MVKRRAHEVCTSLGVDVQQLIELGNRAGVVIKNQMTAIDEEDVLKLAAAQNQAKQTKVVEERVGSGVIRRRAVRRPKAAELTPEETEAGDASLDAGQDEAPPEGESDQVEEAAVFDGDAGPVAPTADASMASDVPPEASPAETPAPEEIPPVQDEPVQESGSAEAVEQIVKPSSRLVHMDDEDEEGRRRRQQRQPRQISKVVKHIDLSEIQAPPAARPPRPGPGSAPGFGPRPGSGGPGGPPGGGPIVTRRGRPAEGAPAEPVQPAVEYHGKRRSKDKPVDYDEGGRDGKGFRKRQVIDETYVTRRGRGGKKKRGERELPGHTLLTTPKAAKRVIRMGAESIIVSELAKRMGIKATELIKELLRMGLSVQINQAVDLDTATLLASEFGYEVENVAFEEDKILDGAEHDNTENLTPRNPVVTVMGHVDHGKTSILDYIRKTRVAEGEAGGITQHIGAYVVRKESGDITFLDTPGHEAFTSMRARGAQVTDLVILVVAADDGVMPQTIEAINHARGGKVPLIVAINKIDKHNANPEKVRTELMLQSVIPEEVGGDTIMVNVSAKTGKGIDTLLEMVTLQAEVLGLKANPSREQAEAVVIEGKLDRGRGPVATVLVRQGTLRIGDNFVCGAQAGKIKAMNADTGQRITEAFPSMPVEILGFADVPEAGDVFNTLKSEKEAKSIAQNRYLKKRESELAKTSRVSLEELVERVKAGSMKTLSLVIKGDVQGTVEALREALVKEATSEVKIDIIHSGVGGITESDVLFASASHALIVGFNVRPEAKAQALADKEGIEIKLYNIIYDVIEDINDAILGLTAPKIREEILGRIEVRDVFTIPKVGTIAGSYVLEGKAVRGARVRVLRDNIVIYTGRIASLRRFKDDVAEVQTGYECGVGVESFNDIKIGDQVEFFHDVEIKATSTRSSTART